MANQNQADSQVNQQKSSPRASHPGRDGEAAAGDRLGERSGKPVPATAAKELPTKEEQKIAKQENKSPLGTRGLDF